MVANPEGVQNLKARVARAAWFVLAALAVLAPWLISAYELTLLSQFLALSILAAGLVLLWGEAGILSLGQGVFFGLGGYALAMNLKLAALSPGELPDFMTWSGRDSLPWWWVPFGNPYLALAAAVLVPGIAAALFSWLVFRRRVGGVYFALVTQALALCFATLLVSQQASTGGFNGLTDFQNSFRFRSVQPGNAPRPLLDHAAVAYRLHRRREMAAGHALWQASACHEGR